VSKKSNKNVKKSYPFGITKGVQGKQHIWAGGRRKDLPEVNQLIKTVPKFFPFYKE